jgi:hypothetical protein
MSNLWFLWFLQECHEELLGVEVSSRHSGQPWLESLTLGLFGL